ncbi:hypothetical protein JHK85_040402 [Glycine max]|nr:hypothetical protein JHK85_040402 [Glycine max]
MASMNLFTTIFLVTDARNPAIYFPRRWRPNTVPFAASSPASPPEIELEFVGGKLMNCGGGGSCGTCIVEVRNCVSREENSKDENVENLAYQSYPFILGSSLGSFVEVWLDSADNRPSLPVGNHQVLNNGHFDGHHHKSHISELVELNELEKLLRNHLPLQSFDELKETSKALATCTYEEGTQWGEEV